MRSPLDTIILAALAEDIGQADITTEATVAPHARCEAHLIAKQNGIVSGIQPFRRAFILAGAELQECDTCLDGEIIQAGDVIAMFQAETQPTLTAERTAMNFVQHLSGVATLTNTYVEALGGLPARICDTRKTTPMLRKLEKEAVRHGGGANHRHDLSCGILIKENHITAAGSIPNAIEKARAYAPHLLRIEVEVNSLKDFDIALAAEPDIIMLDNMNLEDMKEAVSRAKDQNILIEASGNVSLQNVRDIAKTGVDYISVGALTHSAPAVDMSLLINNV